MKKLLLIAVGAALMLASCSTPKNIAYFQDTEEAEGAQIVPVKNITLRPGDMISIIVNAKTADAALVKNVNAARLLQSTNTNAIKQKNAAVNAQKLRNAKRSA